MNTIEGRLVAVESRVGHLESWAGPGQVEALSTGLMALRADLAAFRREVRSELGTLRHRDVGTLKSDMTEVKTRLGRMEDTMAEVLRRLPPPPDGH